MVVMAEDFDKRHKQSKVFNNIPNLQINTHCEDDLTSQANRKKVRSSKSSGRMNPVGLTSTHQSASSSNTSSKTVAAILKQQKDFKLGDSMSAPRSQHLQQQFQRKGLSHKNAPSASSGLQDNLNFGKSVNSPKNIGHGGSSTPANISPAMSPSNAQVVSPAGRESNHSITTKSSSLSRELSPSRITAQIVKVMADTSQSSTQNLLLSVLQGNMPDPMGILNSSKPDTSSSVSASNHTIPLASRISPGNKNNNPTPNTLSSQHSTFIPASSAYDSGGLFLNQISSLEERGSPSDAFSTLQQVHGSNVSNLLTASAGSVQTVNVSHIPKTTNIPLGMNPVGPLSSGHSLSSSSPRHSPRSAMEVAQQIKLEANGQSASAQKVAMQQQLRSQIKGSRSLDAQLASSRQNVGGNGPAGSSDQQQPFNSHQMHPMKEMEQQKTLEASMPLLASKLSSVPSSPNVSSNIGMVQQNSKMKQNLPLTASLLKSPLPSSTNPSTLHNFSEVNPPSTLSSPSSLSIRKPVHRNVSSQQKPTNTADSKQHRQQLQKQFHSQQQQQQQQQQPLLALSSSSVPSAIESTAISNESLWQQQQNQKGSSSYLPLSIASSSTSSSVGLAGVRDQNKQPMLQRLIQASDASGMSEHTVQTDIVMKTEGQVQAGNPTLSKHVRVGTNNNSTGLNSFPGLSTSSNKGKMSQSIQAVGIGGLGQTLHSGSLPMSSSIEKRRKSGPGESKQTAIDVDMDFGNLPSIAGDDQSNAITNISHNIQFGSISPGGSETIPLLLGKNISGVYQQQQQQQHDIKLSNATFVKDITGVSNPSGSGGDLSSFLPIHSSPSPSAQTNFSKTTRGSTVQTAQPLMQTSKPISYPYPSSAAMTVSTAAGAVPNFLNPGDFNNPPPPPYPSSTNKSQQSIHQQNQNAILLQQQQQQQMQQHQQQPFTTKSSVKHSVRNPFTFPTTGVKVQAGHDSTGLLSYTINPQPLDDPVDKTFVKSESSTTSSMKNRHQGALGKSQSDISYLSSSRNPQSFSEDTKSDMPRLLPQTTFKLEDRGGVIKTEVVPTTEEQSMVQPFNQRVSNLSCLPVTNTVYRASYRTHAIAVQRARSGVITNTAKTLDVLRQNIQRSINKEIAGIIKKYTNKFFEPALANIRQNSNEDLLGNEHLNHVCRQILEEAKSEYSSSLGRRSVTPTTDMFDNISDSGSASGRRPNLKRSRISDSDSEKGSEAGSVKRSNKKKGRAVFGSGRVTPSKTIKAGDLIKKEGPKWDPDRLKTDTLFIMGAKANKALGLGNTRGRLYIRHPDIFKYVGDSEDKLWLCERGLMPPTGGKAYLMLVQDIEDLSKSDDYRDSPSLLMHECRGFNVPEWMVVKMKEQMRSQRTDGHLKTQLNSETQFPFIPHMQCRDLVYLSQARVKEQRLKPNVKQARKTLNQEVEEHSANNRPKTLPFSTFTDVSIKVETQPSPADTEDMEFLSTIDVDDHRPSSSISPFNMTGGFDEAGTGSLSPAELGAMDDRPVSSIFT